ncbi:hypothetical protein J0S82_006662, partial [Galemys pyrenaicus]
MKINDLEDEDAATYYCAIWDHNIETANKTYTKINFKSVPTHIPHPSNMGTTKASHLSACPEPSFLQKGILSVDPHSSHSSGILMTPPIYARVQHRCAHLRMPTLECSQHL